MKRAHPDYSTTIVEEKLEETLDFGSQSEPVLKLKRIRQPVEASKRLAFELSEYSTQQEILETLVDLEKELPLESSEVSEFVIRTLWDRFYETSDSVVKIKVISLLMRVGSLPGVNLHALVEDLTQLLNTDDENRRIGKIFYFVHLISDCVSFETFEGMGSCYSFYPLPHYILGITEIHAKWLWCSGFPNPQPTHHSSNLCLLEKG